MTVQLIVDGVTVYSSERGTPTPIPVPVPIPTPVPTPVGTWNLNPVSLWPVPPLRGVIITVPFLADAIRFPNGVEIGGVDESNGLAKNYVISEHPGSFTPVGGNPLGAKYGAGSTMGPIYLRFGPVRPRSMWGFPLPTLDLPLTPGQIYYINVQAADGSGLPISTQFVCTKRTE